MVREVRTKRLSSKSAPALPSDPCFTPSSVWPLSANCFLAGQSSWSISIPLLHKIHHFFHSASFLFFVGSIWGKLLYSVVLVSDVQQHKSAVIIHTPPPAGASLTSPSPAPPGHQSVRLGPLCCMVTFHQLPVLQMVVYMLGLPCSSNSKEPACDAGEQGSIPRWGSSPGGGMATHSSILAWRIPWTEKPGGPQSMVSRRVRRDWATNTHTQVYTLMPLSPSVPLHSSPTLSISPFSTTKFLFLPCKQVHQCHFSGFHIYALMHDICFSLSGLLHSVWQALGSSASLELIQMQYFLWLSNIPLYICATSSLSIHLSMDIQVASMS